MQTFNTIRDLLIDLLDVESDAIALDTYLVRDLEMESIDFLELAVSLNSKFQVPVEDDEVFLHNLRIYLDETAAAGQDALVCLQERYHFLSKARCREILADLHSGPVLKVKDLVDYVQWQMQKVKAA